MKKAFPWALPIVALTVPATAASDQTPAAFHLAAQVDSRPVYTQCDGSYEKMVKGNSTVGNVSFFSNPFQSSATKAQIEADFYQEISDKWYGYNFDCWVWEFRSLRDARTERNKEMRKLSSDGWKIEIVAAFPRR